MAYTTSIGLTGLPTIYNVSFPVGPSMPNVRDDVLLVQTLMKLANFDRIHPGHGPVEASRNITVDGYFGPQTKRMIEAFEEYRRSAGILLIADGVIEPSSKDGYTSKGILYKIVHLNRSAKAAAGWEYDALPFNPTTNAHLQQSLARGAERPSYM